MLKRRRFSGFNFSVSPLSSWSSSLGSKQVYAYQRSRNPSNSNRIFRNGSASGLNLMFRRWATKKTAGSTKNGRDSKPKNLGVKKFGGERVILGNIIVRQRGTRFHPGDYVGMGKDHTLYALKEGQVKFETHKLSGRKWVHVEPKEGHVLHPLYASASSPKLETAA